MSNLPTGTVTFLFTDIEGSTLLWEKCPDTMRTALARHDALLRQSIGERGGWIFKTGGDSFCAAFATAPDAVDAALAVQRALGEPAPEMPLRVRMAVHTGMAEVREGDYFGHALSRVARLLGAGHGGQVLLSLAAKELARDSLPAAAGLLDLGLHELKDLQRPEHIFQLLHPDLAADFPPLRSLNNLPNNLPRQLTSFVGRERETADIKRLLETSCLLTLTGAGGCGKTRIAIQVAADLVEEYTDGVWFAELAPLTDPTLVPQTVASALGVREEAARPLTQTLVDWTRGRRLLLVLDNCEHLALACAHLTETLLQACPHLRILATSREPLGIGGERTFRVPSLTLPTPASATSPETLTQYEAVRLFIERANAALPAFVVTAENAPAIAQICHRLDGVPLAIELAAARVKVLAPEQISCRLDDRFHLLTGGSRTALPRQQTLRALIDWSYDLLSDGERRLLRRLSVFAGGWTLTAAESIGMGDGIESWEVLDLLSGLVDKSLVTVEEQGDETRYRLQETVRQYSRDRLEEAGEAESARTRHREWYLALAQAARPQLHGPEQVVWLDRLDTEHDNLRAALHASPPGDLRLAAALWVFWELHSYLNEGRENLTRALAAESGREWRAERAEAFLGAGRLAWCQGDYGPARAFYEEALALFQEADDKRGIAEALNGLGNVAQFQCEFRRARTLYEQCLVLQRELGNERAVAGLLTNLGVVSTDLGDWAAAHRFFDESQRVSGKIDDKWVAGILHWGRGNLAIAEGDYTLARCVLTEALSLARSLRTTWCIPYALDGLGCLAAAQGQSERAARLLGASDALREQIGTFPPPAERARRAPSLAAVRAALGDDAFACVWAAGRALSFEEILGYAGEPSPDIS